MGAEGRARLRAMLQEALAAAPKPHSHKWSVDDRHHALAGALAELADVEEDVDAYIAAVRAAGSGVGYAVEIAKRLTDRWGLLTGGQRDAPERLQLIRATVEWSYDLLSDEVQVEVYAKALNLTTRSDMTDNEYFAAEPLVQDVAKALEVGTTPYTLTFFEQINSPQGPWLQMLQRAYYTDDDLDTVIAETKDQMKAIASGQ